METSKRGGSEPEERSADLMEQASATTELFLNANLSNQLGKSAPESHPDFDGVHCVEADCGVELPQARRAMRRIRCVDCQSRIELARKQYPK